MTVKHPFEGLKTTVVHVEILSEILRGGSTGILTLSLRSALTSKRPLLESKDLPSSLFCRIAQMSLNLGMKPRRSEKRFCAIADFGESRYSGASTNRQYHAQRDD